MAAYLTYAIFIHQSLELQFVCEQLNHTLLLNEAVEHYQCSAILINKASVPIAITKIQEAIYNNDLIITGIGSTRGCNFGKYTGTEILLPGSKHFLPGTLGKYGAATAELEGMSSSRVMYIVNGVKLESNAIKYSVVNVPVEKRLLRNEVEYSRDTLDKGQKYRNRAFIEQILINDELWLFYQMYSSEFAGGEPARAYRLAKLDGYAAVTISGLAFAKDEQPIKIECKIGEKVVYSQFISSIDGIVVKPPVK